MELPVFQFVLIASCPDADHHWKWSDPIHLPPVIQVLVNVDKIPSQPSLSQAEQPQVSQPFLIRVAQLDCATDHSPVSSACQPVLNPPHCPVSIPHFLSSPMRMLRETASIQCRADFKVHSIRCSFLIHPAGHDMVIKSLELEMDLWMPSSPSPLQWTATRTARSGWPGPDPSSPWESSGMGHPPTTLWDSLFQCLTTLTVEEFFLLQIYPLWA